MLHDGATQATDVLPVRYYLLCGISCSKSIKQIIVLVEMKLDIFWDERMCFWAK